MGVFKGQPWSRIFRPARPAGGPSAPTLDLVENVLMATTVHIPEKLLAALDQRAKALGVSRNRLIVRALQDAVSARTGWAPEFLDRLRDTGPDLSATADEMLDAISKSRRSRAPRAL
jgi:predicted transcriptional regulator